jgi:hypothetical protein
MVGLLRKLTKVYGPMWRRMLNSETPEERLRAIVQSEPLLALRGSGRELWAEELADEYIRRLRDNW